ncbi:hypothetical protein K469DRAFT_748585 [Zopfia rhizophila CBS 207.26]|uniref:Uncharacterized protein n=1 Tax=Zopfia rhizophila CBS 207.26 TaxID=1314779 RepID=A0A6A6ECF9_9PEZI|nr:hypothetical protein K469DRAFT_748585 [Zopfia rhizophila CBS 207.26]
MASWKITPDPSESLIEYTPFLASRKFFAVDDSGSTAGSILKREQGFVQTLHKQKANTEDSISLWGSNCDHPTDDFESAKWKSNHLYTWPASILNKFSALEKIKKSDIWFLLTDGEIYDNDVYQLAELASQVDVLSVPVVFIITDARNKTETGKIYVIAAKGCFASLGGSAVKELGSWKDIPVFHDELLFFKHCEKLEIRVPTAESRDKLPKGAGLGSDWENTHSGNPVFVDLDLLPKAGFLSDEDILSLFADEAFNALAVAYKTRKRTAELRSFVQAQKIEQVAPKLEDISGAAAIISQMGEAGISESVRKTLQEQLRGAHAKNRENYKKTIADFVGSTKEQSRRKRNQLVDAALRSLSSIEAAGSTADILSRRSNRARRAEVVASDNSVALANLNFDDGPSCKGFCLVCCGEEELMSISLKELDSADTGYNTTDFALNFPLAAGTSSKNVNIISSQNVCFQCALLGPSGMSIYKEKLKAIIAAVQYQGSNKKYINDQLYLALTEGLQTGTAGVTQVFMATLEETLRTKSWAGAGLCDSQLSVDEQHETVQRRRTFEWMLDQLLSNTQTRETFSDVGEWVAFPTALKWVARNFEENGLASFFVTYPIAGHATLLSLGQKTGVFSRDTVVRMQISKVVYRIVFWYLEDLLKHQAHPGEWKHPYLNLIYQDFNAFLVPKDFGGTRTLVTDVETFRSRLMSVDFMPHEQLQSLPEEDMQSVMPFKTPFCGSVLHCGFERCNESFLSVDHGSALDNIEIIRKARTKHLIKAFGIKRRFEKNETGLPEATSAPTPPSSAHTNLHITVVRTWAEQTRERKRAILDDADERASFVRSVRKRICEGGRGDIFNENIEQDICEVLPSFFQVLGEALKFEGRDDSDITVYEHDLNNNSLEAKIKYELMASGLLNA